MTETSERRYQMTRVRAGDYLLPSNDGKRLWRVSSYVEDGSLVEYDADDRAYERGRPVVGTFWRASYFRGDDLAAAERLLQRDADAFLEWDRWTEHAAMLPTRREALAAALGSTIPTVHVDLRGRRGSLGTVSLDDQGVAQASNAEQQAFLDSLNVVEPGTTAHLSREDGERYLRALPANLRGQALWAVLVEN